MPKLGLPTTRVSMHLNDVDIEALKSMTTPDLNFSELVRTILHKFCTEASARARAKIDTRPEFDYTSPAAIVASSRFDADEEDAD